MRDSEFSDSESLVLGNVDDRILSSSSVMSPGVCLTQIKEERQISPLLKKLSDREIIASVIQKNPKSDSDADVEKDSIPASSIREVKTVLSAVRSFYISESNVTDQIFYSIAKLESVVMKISFIQLTLKESQIILNKIK